MDEFLLISIVAKILSLQTNMLSFVSLVNHI